MPSVFTFDEYVDILLIYGECQKNSRRARELYRVRYPDRVPPNKNTFAYVEKKLRNGCFPNWKPKTPRRKFMQTEDNVISILAYVAVDPHVSTRLLARELEVSRTTVQRVLKTHKYHPYKIHLVQGLSPQDPEQRLHFISEILVKLEEDPLFLNKILWSDESRFHNNGIVNRHNCHYWSPENPYWIRETHFQQVWGVNVWCGIFNGRLIGPYFYEGTLTGERYLEFLQHVLPVLIEDVPLRERVTMWWQHDGAPPHFSQQVTEYLHNIFPGRWIGRNGIIHWPARSPDITPLDFFLWGYLKSIVYATQPTDLEDLKNKIIGTCGTITAEMIRATCTRNLISRFEYCVSEGGNQFEHL